VIEIDGVSVAAGERTILRGISLTISGQRTAIIGANGSGKSTLARLLNGIDLPTEGRVVVDGLDTRTDEREVRRRVGFVFQDPDAQLVYPTPLEDVALGLRARGIGRDEAGRRARVQLEQMGIGGKALQAIHTLSGGEKQLASLCGVLVLDPVWLVLDEPTTSLDLRNRRQVVEAIAALDQSVIAVTHDLDLVRDMDRAILLDTGTVAADGTPADVIDEYLRRTEDAARR
jgi:biotin transport system ATP-binding protein